MLETLEKIRENLCTRKAIEIKEYFTSALLSNLYSITPEIVKPTSIPWKKLALCGGMIALICSLPFIPPYLESLKTQQRVNQLKEIGLTEEQANSFDSIYRKFADETWFSSSYNKTILGFAAYYRINQKLAEEVFRIYSDFKNSNEFLSFAIDIPNSLEFSRKYPRLLTTFNFADPLELYSKDPRVFEELFKSILRDKRVKDKEGLASLASDLFLDLNLYGNVKVLIPGTDSYEEQPLNKLTIQRFANYSFCLQNGFPRHDKETLFLLGNFTQINPVDFKTLILKGENGIVIIGIDPARETYSLATHLSYTPYLIHEAKIYPSILRKIAQENYILCDYLKRSVLDESDWEEIKIPNFVYHFNLWKENKSLLPLDEETLIKMFPSDEDRDLIDRARWLPIQMADFDLKRGKYYMEGDRDSIKHNLEAIVEKKLYERIIRLYNDKDSEDHKWARWSYDVSARFGDDFWPNVTEKFLEVYDPLLKKDPRLDLLRFMYGLAAWDRIGNIPIKSEPPYWDHFIAEQYHPFVVIIYAKALGDSSFKMRAPYPEGGWHSEPMFVLPHYLLKELPETAITGKGYSIAAIFADKILDKDMPRPYYVEQQLPTGHFIVIHKKT